MNAKKIATIRTVAVVWEYGKFAIALIPLALALLGVAGVIKPLNGGSFEYGKF